MSKLRKCSGSVWARRCLRFLKKTLNRLYYFWTWDPWGCVSYSQEGEDLILARIFEDRLTGFYVDIGAHHPFRFSNTCLFYRRGWQGINIDAMPGSMRIFRKHRPKDINLEIGVGERREKLPFHMFNDSALNGFSSDLSIERDETTTYFIEDVVSIDVVPLGEILDEHLPSDQGIDFMSVDVEGHDLQVLKSNDWERYRPKYVLVEVLGCNVGDAGQSDVGLFMFGKGYELYAKSVNTAFFKEAMSWR